MTSCYLEPGLIEAFYRLHFPGEPEEAIRQKAAGFAEGARAGRRDLRDYVALLDDDGALIWTFAIYPEEEGAFFVQPTRFLRDVDVPVGAWLQAARLVADRLRERGARRAGLRFTKGRLTEHLPAALGAAGFEKRGDRIEFKVPLADLPGEEGTPLEWRAVGDGIDLEFAAKVMEECAQGDPSADPGESALASIQASLGDEALYGGLDAVQVGFLGGEPAAFVFAQVDQKSGWSRITYMGLAPAFRGRGLGRWVHRRGFAVLRRQGGTDYHGGTAATNAPMLATFRAHGCPELRRMEDWLYRP